MLYLGILWYPIKSKIISSFCGYSILYKGYNPTRFSHQKSATHVASPAYPFYFWRAIAFHAIDKPPPDSRDLHRDAHIKALKRRGSVSQGSKGIPSSPKIKYSQDTMMYHNGEYLVLGVVRG